MALFLLGESKTAKYVELSDGTVLGLNRQITRKSKDFTVSIVTSALRDQGWTVAKSIGTMNVPDKSDPTLEHSALVFDCGRSETKAIRLELLDTADGKQLSVQVQSVAPAILSFLGNPAPTTISETKQYQEMVKEAQNANKGVPDFNKYFLKSKERVKSDYIIDENDFIAWFLEQKNERHVSAVILGPMDWYHGASGAVLEKAKKIQTLLSQEGVLCLKLGSEEECVYLAASAAYAAHAVGMGQIHGVIDVNANRLDYMRQMQTVLQISGAKKRTSIFKPPVQMDCGWQIGQNAMKTEYTKAHDATAALKLVDDYVNSQVLTNHLEGRVGYEMEKAVQNNRDIRDASGKLIKQTGTVLCIAEMEDTNDIGNGTAQFADTVSAALCVKKFMKQVSELEANAKENPVDFFASRFCGGAK